ncbi:MAG: hypothetical protein ABII01_07010 [Candidatus Woesearchaeota archaeon]
MDDLIRALNEIDMLRNSGIRMVIDPDPVQLIGSFFYHDVNGFFIDDRLKGVPNEQCGTVFNYLSNFISEIMKRPEYEGPIFPKEIMEEIKEVDQVLEGRLKDGIPIRVELNEGRVLIRYNRF